ncbi:MAG: CpsD/CapB family tyrosine-protein kinase [Oscillospiraceae bacterium]|nr:CpsD/CapB family tyrosine-protein kinase [Oscillospiraceae bacterium]
MGLFSFSKSKRRAAAMSRKERPRLSPSSPFAIKEAYNSIRTKLIFTGKGEKCPVFAVTSSLAGDGKSTNAVSLAVSIAMAEQKVLLIDADMRKPSIHRYFNTEHRNGLSEILANLTNEVKLRPTDNPNLSILTAGQIPPNPAELLGSKQMDTLLDYVRQYFDYVIIDTPPVNIVTDASVIAGKITGYVLVVQSGKNHIRDISDAIHKIEEMKGTIVGLVLNDPYNRAEAHYSYMYKKYYRYDKYKYYGERSSEQHR